MSEYDEHIPYIKQKQTLITFRSLGALLCVQNDGVEVVDCGGESREMFKDHFLCGSSDGNSLLLSSAVFGLAHYMVACRKTCGARKELMYHKIDEEAVKYLLYCLFDLLVSLLSLELNSYVFQVLSCQPGFLGYKKAHSQSFTRSDCKLRQNSFRVTTLDIEDLLQPRLLANADSLFINIEGLNIHYKQFFFSIVFRKKAVFFTSYLLHYCNQFCIGNEWKKG